jgi:N-acetyl-gamma-glutamyl-phosphate reductase
MIRVAIVGATGYAGAELVRLLSGHPHVTLTTITSRNYIGEAFDRVYPGMSGVVNLECEEYDISKMDENADVIFTALPHKLPMEMVPELIDKGKKVIDLSADFRFRDVNRYEAHYQPHAAKELLSQAVYGLTEVYTDDIRNANLIGNPGCYPTSILLPLVPLVRKGMLELNSLIADSKSGVSGAGRSPSLATLYCAVSESFKAYKVAAHRHNPEIEEVLSQQVGKDVSMTFVPHLLPMSRGMETTIYAKPAAGVELKDVRSCLKEFYDGRYFIRLCADGSPPDTLHVRGTNFCDIGFVMDKDRNRLILMSTIDNLVKGAAGQAVQNMNVMFGMEESSGLSQVPYPL